MTVFRYKALTDGGKRASGTIEASSRREATQALREQGMHVTAMEQSGGAVADRLRRISGSRADETYVFTSHMRRLLRARLPLVEALEATGKETASSPMGQVVSRLRDRVAGGSALGEALSQEREYFDEMYIAMIQAAQASGSLVTAFDNIHDYERRRREFQSRLTSAMAYPMVLVTVAFLATLFLVGFVVPKISAVLISAGGELPVTTRILIAVSDVASSYWYVVIIVVGAAAFAPRMLRWSARGRLFVDRAVLRIPLVRRFAKSAIVARFSRTFYSLLGTGLRVAEALDVAGKVTGNSVFEEAVSHARSRIMSGGDLAGALAESDLFPNYAIQVVGVGERTGMLTDSFSEIADSEEEDLQTMTDRFMTFLEPAIIVIMAAVVGFIVASVLLPILSMSKIGV